MSKELAAAVASMSPEMKAMLLTMIAPAPTAVAPAKAKPIRSKSSAPQPTAAPVAVKAARTWTYSHDVVSQFGEPCEVYINSRQPQKPRLVAKDLAAAIRSRR